MMMDKFIHCGSKMNDKIIDDGWNSSFMDGHGWTSPIIHEQTKLNEYFTFKN
jgi:outer membrane protease